MGERTDRTVKNWRWWIALPCMAALLPVLVIDFLLWLATWCATFAHDAADDTRDFLSATFRPYTQALGKWVIGGRK